MIDLGITCVIDQVVNTIEEKQKRVLEHPCTYIGAWQHEHSRFWVYQEEGQAQKFEFGLRFDGPFIRYDFGCSACPLQDEVEQIVRPWFEMCTEVLSFMFGEPVEKHGAFRPSNWGYVSGQNVEWNVYPSFTKGMRHYFETCPAVQYLLERNYRVVGAIAEEILKYYNLPASWKDFVFHQTAVYVIRACAGG